MAMTVNVAGCPGTTINCDSGWLVIIGEFTAKREKGGRRSEEGSGERERGREREGVRGRGGRERGKERGREREREREGEREREREGGSVYHVCIVIL